MKKHLIYSLLCIAAIGVLPGCGGGKKKPVTKKAKVVKKTRVSYKPTKELIEEDVT